MHLIEGIAGLYEGTLAWIPEEGLTVGKLPDNDLVLDDPYVSRTHAHFGFRDGRVWVRDLGSTNGVYVNDVQVREQALKHGDLIQIGGTLFRYRDRPIAVLKDQDLPAPPPPPTVPQAASSGPATPLTGSVTVSRIATPSVLAPAPALPERTAAALAALARARPGSLTLEQYLERILELVFDLLPAERGCVVLLDERGEPEPRAMRSRQDGGAEDMPLSRTLLRRVIEERSAVLVRDALHDAALALAGSVVARRLRCVAYAPICFGDEVLGALCLETARPGGLQEADLDALMAFANQAALVTYQARLQDQVQREFERRMRLMRFMAQSVAQEYLETGQEPALGGEEREISILFADLRGYTAMSENLPPGEVVGLLNMVFERLDAVVRRYEGTLDKYIGDCVMALFGAPVGDDRHCVRAVRAALAMQQEMEALNRTLAEKYGELTLGIGINSGTAVVGLIGTEHRMDYTAIGDAVNIAARVEELAAPGQILVTESVARHVQEHFRVEPASACRLRGRQQVTHVYRIAGERAEPGPGPESAAP